MTPTSVSFRGQGQGWRTFFHPPIFPLAAAPFFGRWLWVVAGCVRVTSAVFSIFILYLGAAKNKPITVTDVNRRAERWATPRDTPRSARRASSSCMRCSGCRRTSVLCADYQLRQQWIDNNMSYLDGRALAVLQSEDSDFRRSTWSVYHNLYMCRLGVCPQWLWGRENC
eukprot:scaffold7181_cov113-Isochrysis_galbana.AAC.3